MRMEKVQLQCLIHQGEGEMECSMLVCYKQGIAVRPFLQRNKYFLTFRLDSKMHFVWSIYKKKSEIKEYLSKRETKFFFA